VLRGRRYPTRTSRRARSTTDAAIGERSSRAFSGSEKAVFYAVPFISRGREKKRLSMKGEKGKRYAA